MGDEELVALAEAAEEIGRSREWLRLKVRDGDVRHVRVGRTIGIPRAEIRRLKKLPKLHGGWPKGRPRKSPPAPHD
jgi:hypothetical protein